MGHRGIPPSHPFSKIAVMPNDVRLPPIFLLGSSDYSAELSAQVGMGFAFAHHFASYDARAAMLSLPEPFRSVALAERALRHSGRRRGLRRGKGRGRLAGFSADYNWLRRRAANITPCRARSRRWRINTPTASATS